MVPALGWSVAGAALAAMEVCVRKGSIKILHGDIFRTREPWKVVIAFMYEGETVVAV